MAFNLNAKPALALKDTYVLHLLDPATDEKLYDDEGAEVTITLFGQSSKQYRNYVAGMQNRELRRRHKKETQKAEDLEAEQVNLLAACSATSTLELDGGPVDNKEAFKTLYANPSYAWIRSQVDEALGNPTNFFGSVTDSLKLYVRHLAWLHATPKGSEKSRMTSFKALDENHLMLQMPDIESEHAAGYVIGLLQEAGLMSTNGMGPVPISWQEIYAWLRTTGMDIGLWEKLMIKSLSEEYVAELMQANDPNRVPPYSAPSPEEIQRAVVADKIMNTLSKFIRRD